MDLSFGDISFYVDNGQLAISYSKKAADSDQVVSEKLIDQSYDN